MIVINLAKRFKNSIKRLLFTTSTHLQARIVPNSVRSLLGHKVFGADFSEIDGFDNIRNPQGAFLESQKLASKIYGSGTSFYLYNGSTSGILALMLAVLKKGDRVIIARNAHISVIQGLILTGASAFWVMPEKNKDFGVFSFVKESEIEAAFEKCPDAKAVIITSPTYEGIKSDVRSIAKLCHQKKVPLIVDEAHGALWNFSENLPETAIRDGADASVQSLHKNAGALNQGAILHLSESSLFDKGKVQQCLNLINSTSPSFPILSSVEGAIHFLASKKGEKALQKLLDSVICLRERLSALQGVEILENDDPSRIFLKVENMNGFELSKVLGEKFKIEDELANSSGALFVTGMGTSVKKLERLYRAVKNISKLNRIRHYDNNKAEYALPEIVFNPQEAFHKKGKIIALENSVGMIAKEILSVYPPGIAVLVPGERISENHIKLLENEYVEVVDE